VVPRQLESADAIAGEPAQFASTEDLRAPEPEPSPASSRGIPASPVPDAGAGWQAAFLPVAFAARNSPTAFEAMVAHSSPPAQASTTQRPPPSDAAPDPARELTPGVGGASAGGATGTAGAPLLALTCALLLVVVGGWSRLVLLSEAYRSSVFLALPERPG
jgi:hypothetical protein